MRKQSVSANAEKENSAIILAEQAQIEANKEAQSDDVEVEATSEDETEAPEKTNGGGSERHKKWRTGTDKVKKFFEKVAEYSHENPEILLNWNNLVASVKRHEEGTTTRQQRMLAMLEDL